MISTPLPDLSTLDREALMKIVLDQQSQMLAQQNQLIEQQQEASRQMDSAYQELESASQKIEHLKLVVEKYKRMLFGTKSEKIKGQLEQLEFHLEELEIGQAAMEAALPAPAPAVDKPRRRATRKPLPEELPPEVITYPPATTCCPDCGGALRQFGEDVSEQLERIPASYKVIQHVRPKFACAACEQVVQAPAPTRPIDQGLPGPALLAHVLVSKFADHLPLYRQSEIYSREGIELSRSTLAGWVGAATELLSPLVDQIRRYVMAGSKIHADDTPVAVLAPGHGKTKTARLWTYVRDDRAAGCQSAAAVWFAYSEDRKGEHPRQHLKGFRGALQADAYAGFHHLYGEGAIYEVACWAHARRKFHEIHQAHASPTTSEALMRIGALYGIEEEIRGKPTELRSAIRQARARPLLDSLRHWMESPAPTRPIDQGLPGPALLAHVLVSKFADHLPLYRQSETYSREGIELSGSTLAGWVGAATELLSPLVDQIRRYVMAGLKIHADDTPVAVLAPGQGKTKTARLWTYVRDDRPAGCQSAAAAWFAYSEDRKGEHPRQHLKGFHGALQADAYAGFHHLYGGEPSMRSHAWPMQDASFIRFIRLTLPLRPAKR